MSSDLEFLLQLKKEFKFDHCYDFYNMAEVFQAPLQKIINYLNIEGVAIQGLSEDDIQQDYKLGLLPDNFEMMAQPNLKSRFISRGKHPIGIIFYYSDKLVQHDEDLLELISYQIAQPLHLWIKSRRAELAGKVRNDFCPKSMIARSRPMHQVFSLMEKVIETNTTVLILGESGVGKERIANEIHYQSSRKKSPFISVNCAAIPKELIESELFGHRKGSFTGAHEDRKGKFEQANGGTLFLDEIGDLSLEAQSKLLRVLQDKKVTKVGSNKINHLDVRIIAATNAELEEKVQQGLFREDLYYRLNVFPINVPPLRERKDDIIPLSDFFVNKFSREIEKDISRISTSALDMLMAYHWPGNVRELANVLERAVLLSENGVVQGKDLPPSLQLPEVESESPPLLEHRLGQLEKDLIIDSLKTHAGNIRKASQQLGLSERKMGLRIRKYDIALGRFKKNYIKVNFPRKSSFM